MVPWCSYSYHAVLHAVCDIKHQWQTGRHVMKGNSGKGFPADLFKAAARKVTMLDAAIELVDLRVPPANRLEALKGNREGRQSIRINDQ